ncbi:MAG TPA: hypothetical protein VMX35_06720 [Acidobacteriota bacterium]|nr:hypothetical protein [Acidobacteriota bacterium]
MSGIAPESGDVGFVVRQFVVFVDIILILTAWFLPPRFSRVAADRHKNEVKTADDIPVPTAKPGRHQSVAPNELLCGCRRGEQFSCHDVFVFGIAPRGLNSID